MTQQELAEVTSANQGTIARWEKGSLEPSIEQIILLSDTLDSSIDYLLGTVDYDARNIPSVEEYNSFTEELLEGDKIKHPSYELMFNEDGEWSEELQEWMETTDKWWAIVDTYLAGKALGVELVEVMDDC